MKCTRCKQPLSGGSDTFGTVQTPVCMACWFDALTRPTVAETVQMQDRIYVIAGPRKGAMYNANDWTAPQYPHGGWFAVGEERPL